MAATSISHHWIIGLGASPSMPARVTQYAAHVLRARQTMLPVPPAHRGAMLSSLIWSLSNPSASFPYLKPTPSPAPAFSQVIKRGMATVSKNYKAQEDDDESLARFHRAVRDEGESFVDMWSLPLETLGALHLFESHSVWTLTSLQQTSIFHHFLHGSETPHSVITLLCSEITF